MAEGERSQLMHAQKWNNVENHSHQVNPRLNSILLQILRVIQKSLRMFYVSYNYYFMPFFTMIFSFCLSYIAQQ